MNVSSWSGVIYSLYNNQYCSFLFVCSPPLQCLCRYHWPGPVSLARYPPPPPALNIRAGTTGPGRLAGIQGARVPVPVALAQAARLVGIPGDVSTCGIRQFQFTKRLISGPLLGRMGFSDDASFFSPFHNFLY